MEIMNFQSDEINELAAALSKAQSEFGPIPKSRTVDFTDKNGRRVKYNYADLSDVIEVVKGPLGKNGLSHSEQLIILEGKVVLLTRVMHSSGQWLLSSYPITLGMKPQDSGSAITYGRRYCLSSLLGIQAEEDNDGETAPDNGSPPQGSKDHHPSGWPPISQGSFEDDFANLQGTTVANIQSMEGAVWKMTENEIGIIQGLTGKLGKSLNDVILWAQKKFKDEGIKNLYQLNIQQYNAACAMLNDAVVKKGV